MCICYVCIYIYTYYIHIIIYISYTYYIHIIYILYTYYIHIIYISYTYYIHIICILYIHIIYISYTYYIHILYISYILISYKFPIATELLFALVNCTRKIRMMIVRNAQVQALCMTGVKHGLLVCMAPDGTQCRTPSRFPAPASSDNP